MVTSVMRNVCRIGIAVLVLAGAYATVSAQPCPKGQFLAKYYKNENLQGVPFFTKCEKTINNSWGNSGPTKVTGGSSNPKADGGSTIIELGIDHFSVQWTGEFNFAGGDTTFVATADDGIKVWVDNELIIDEWRVQGVREFRATRNLSAGTHRVKVQYYENAGPATARVTW